MTERQTDEAHPAARARDGHDPRVVVVAGASRGIGRALVEQCAARGHHVCGISRSAPDDNGCEGRDDVLWLRCDLGDPDAVEHAIRNAHETFGGVDAVVLVAAITASGPVETLDPVTIDSVVTTNLIGPIHLVRSALPGLRSSGDGRLIIVSSQSAYLPNAFFALYGATKAALEHLAISLSEEVAPTGVRVSVVIPGGVRTGILDGADDRPDAPVPTTEAHYEPRLSRQRRRAIDAVGHGAESGVVAAAICDLLDSADPPLRIIIGSDAEQAVRIRPVWSVGLPD